MDVDHQHLHHQYFLSVQQILRIELLLDQQLILFVCSNQLQRVCNGFLCIHNLANI